MDLTLLTTLLGWMSVINYSILILWFLIFFFANNWYYQLTNYFFKMEIASFNKTNYFFMGFYEIIVILFNLVPYIALKISL